MIIESSFQNSLGCSPNAPFKKPCQVPSACPPGLWDVGSRGVGSVGARDHTQIPRHVGHLFVAFGGEEYEELKAYTNKIYIIYAIEVVVVSTNPLEKYARHIGSFAQGSG